MVALAASYFAAFLVAGPATAAQAPPLVPDLSQRLHPSDSTPWTILFVLTAITLLPAILGDRDAAAGNVSVRLRTDEDLGAMPADDFLKLATGIIEAKSAALK